MSEKKILCKNRVERDAVLRKLEEQGVRWVGGHESPTKWKSNDWGENTEIVLVISSELLSWGYADYYKNEREKLIPAKKFLAKQKTKPILIYRNDNLVTAVDKNTGSFRNTYCSDDDTFDFYTGAMIALCRLVGDKIGEDAKAEMRKVLGEEKKPEEDDIKVGSVVKVTGRLRSFSNYVSWFSINHIDVELAARFAFGKKPFKGEICKVKAIHPHEDSFHGNLYLIQTQGISGECYLMSRKGIEKI